MTTTFGLQHTEEITGQSGEEFLVWVGERFQHSGNGLVYEVTGVQWDGEKDLWALAHKHIASPDAATITRTHKNFFGKRNENGKLIDRFTHLPKNSIKPYVPAFVDNEEVELIKFHTINDLLMTPLLQKFRETRGFQYFRMSPVHDNMLVAEYTHEFWVVGTFSRTEKSWYQQRWK